MFGKKKNENEPELTWGKSEHSVLDKWPLDEYGEPELAVPVASVSDMNGEAEMKISLLNAYGIPVSQRYNNAGDIGKVINGFSAYGMTLFVPESMGDDAKALLEAPADMSEAEEAAEAADSGNEQESESDGK